MPTESFQFGALDANCHILFNEEDAVIIDPSDDTASLAGFAEAHGVRVRALLLTHLHFDHALGAASASELFKVKVYVGKEDWDMREVLLGQAGYFGFSVPRVFQAVPITEGRYMFGSLDLLAMKCPGHSPGSLCYYSQKERVVFSGDVLFFRSVGRSDLPGGDAEELEDSIRNKLYVLPEETIVLCGHGEPTTIGDEMRKNMYCRARLSDRRQDHE